MDRPDYYETHKAYRWAKHPWLKADESVLMVRLLAYAVGMPTKPYGDDAKACRPSSRNR